MAQQSSFYITDGVTRTYPSSKHIASKQHVAVYFQSVTTSTWSIIEQTLYDLVNNSIVFTDAPDSALYSQIEIRVADTAAELTESPSDIATVAGAIADVTTVAGSITAVETVSSNTASVTTVSGSIANVNTVATNVANVNTVATNIASVNTVAANIVDVSSVADTIVPNIAEILLADTNATTATTQAGIATTKAGEASTSATNAQLSAWEAEAEKMTADSYATEAEDVLVKVYTSNGDGTFTTTPTTEYSALHWAAKSALAAQGDAVNIRYDNATSGLTATNVQTAIDEIDSRNDAHVPLSGVTSYHLLSGNLALANSVITNGFATTLYTGNGTTQSVVTGVDMATQWGNSTSETFGGLVWIKNRGAVGDNALCDTVRGTLKYVSSNLTTAQAATTSITSFNNNGFSLGIDFNQNTNTYASWVFQTTHRITGTTNHGKAYTCHYNPFTGFTMVKYEGSGIAGHEIPHHLGRKLGLNTIKNLSAVAAWATFAPSVLGDGSYLYLNQTSAVATGGTNTSNETSYILGNSSVEANTSANQYVLYGWANSYFDEANTLIGNYEIGIYQGTGVAGNKVTTRGKPAWVMIKRLDSTGDWSIFDNQRVSGINELGLYANLSIVEDSTDRLTWNSDGFSLVTTAANQNASGGQYLYMVVYDNDSGSGKSKYPRATDTSTLNLNATIPFANGLDTNGVKNSILSKNETVAGLTLQEGKNYVYVKNDGTYGVDYHAPQYHTYNGFGNYFDINKNQWYQSPSVLADDCSTASGWAVTNGTVVSNGSDITVTRSGGTGAVATRTISTVAGQRYRLRSYVYAVTSAAYMYVDTTAALVVSSGTRGNYYKDFVATGTSFTLTITIDNDGGKAIFDNISIYPINNDGSVDTSSATPITESRNYLDAIVYADAGGQPTYVEQLPKTEYKDAVKANEFQGKNACTAWVIFDGTTTPPTIHDSFNIKAVVRTATGEYDGYFDELMDTTNFSVNLSAAYNNTLDISVREYSNIRSTQKIRIAVALNTTNTLQNANCINVHIFGGKN